MSYQPQSSTLALAAVCQAAALVQQVSRTSIDNKVAEETSLGSILVVDASSTDTIFGSLGNLTLGFRTLTHQLGGRPIDKDAEVTRYIAGILGLERKLARNKQALSELGKRIEQLQRQTSLYDVNSSQMTSNMASVYADIISHIGPRIQVAGNPTILKQPAVQEKVRALLLAGIRAAVLWRQLGGKRRQIMFGRKRILRDAANTLRYLENHQHLPE